MVLVDGEVYMADMDTQQAILAIQEQQEMFNNQSKTKKNDFLA